MGVLAALVSALLLILAFPPFGVGVLALVAPIPFLWALRRARSVWVGALYGAVFGLAFFLGLIWWIGALGMVALVPLLLTEAAFPTVFGALLARARSWSPVRWWAAAVGGWALMELMRERFPVGGLSWGMLGYPIGEYAATRGATQWIGTSGWSVVLIGVAAGAVVALERRRFGPLAVSAAAVIGLGIAGWLWPGVAEGEPLRVAIVQGNTPCPGTHCSNERYDTYMLHLEMTRTIPAGSVDLVVWAEGSTGSTNADPILVPEVADAIGDEAARIGAYLLVGGDRILSDSEWINANVLFDRDGEIVGEYRKRQPVPFGEYVPFRSFLAPLIPELSQVPRDMIRGEDPVVFEADFGMLGSVVSWEGSFARFPRDVARNGAQLLVVATNNASYQVSPASDQLIGMTRMRAAELGLDVVHAAVTGKSTLITDGGEVGERTPVYEQALLVGAVQMRDAGPTLYTRVGDWLQVAAALGLVVAVFRRRPTPPEATEEISLPATPVGSG
jgi:apolipoprotein N-acyltransferase